MFVLWPHFCFRQSIIFTYNYYKEFHSIYSAKINGGDYSYEFVIQRYEGIFVSNNINLQIYVSLVYINDLFYINSGMPAFEF